ncbi:MAG: HypC/HybG/HupF family hydrogenase formation chaperone [Dethiobacteria bacterium]|nr:HypC/HybG/HupF family hydrogenase formation chaperone [Dethiobacteria bacterium]
MCLGLPMRLLEIERNQMGLAETLGVSRKISLHLVPDVEIGDYIMVHAGYAIERINTEEAASRLLVLQEMIRELEE